MFPIFAGNSASTGYNLTRSLRFRSSASAYLNRTPASATNQRVMTFSGWVKRGALGGSSYQVLYSAHTGTDVSFIGYGNGAYSAGGDYFEVGDSSSGGTLIFDVRSNAVYRDPSSWYHVVVAIDTTQATAANRILLYVNGVQLSTTTSGTVSLNFQMNFNNTVVHNVGRLSRDTNSYFDGYLTEVNFIDGQALTPSSFGSTNALTGVWQPARYAGTYGTNGFYLPFTDNSALTTSSNVGLGKDFSGNANYWVTNNISITAGVTYDSMTDVPTLTSATAANFCTWNPVAQSTVVNGTVTRSNGNLTSTDGGTTYGLASFGTIAATTGKFYWEVTLSSAGDVYGTIGVVDLNSPLGAGVGTGIIYAQNGNKGSGSGVFNGTGSTAYGATYTTGDIIGVALDLTGGSITFYKNGTSQGVAYTGISGNYTPAVGDGQNTTSYTFNLNCGQRPFTYTPPTGFVALNTYNLPDSTIVKGNTVMDATLYTGTLLSNAITNAAAFKPDFVWLKSRSAATNNELTDSVRGVTKALVSNSTAAETTDTQGLTAFNTNGFTVGTDTNYNNLAATYVAWQWQAGQGSTSSNTNGTITSTVSVNASAGFSVVTYTGTGANATVGHGLGVAPSFVVVKQRSASGNDWQCYHASLGKDYVIQLDLTSSAANLSQYWYNGMTSSVFGINGSYAGINASSATYVAYCWTPIAGFSAFGSYTGNGSTDGVFVYTGFRPRWILWKRSSAVGDWILQDTARSPYNASDTVLFPNYSDAETVGGGYPFDILSNGFKLRNSAAYANASGSTYIYMAFAESPFRNSLAR